MAVARVTGLIAEFLADNRGFRRVLDDTRRQLNRFNSQLDQDASKATTRARRLGVAGRAFVAGVAGTTAVAIIADGVRNVVQATVAWQGWESALRAATGTQNNATRAMSYLRGEANRLGLDLAALIPSFANLAASTRGGPLEGRETYDLFTSISEAARVLRLDADGTRGALRALYQIISKGKVSAEELRGQLGERLPGAFQIAARAVGVTTEVLNDMLKDGKLLAVDFIPAFTREVRKTFGAEVPNAIKLADASFNRLSNSIRELKVSIGESGLVDFLANAAEGAANLFRQFGPEGLAILPAEQIEALQAQRDTLLDEQSGLGVSRRDRHRGVSIRRSIDGIDQQLSRLETLIPARIEGTLTALRTALDEAGGGGRSGQTDRNQIRAQIDEAEALRARYAAAATERTAQVQRDADLKARVDARNFEDEQVKFYNLVNTLHLEALDTVKEQARVEEQIFDLHQEALQNLREGAAGIAGSFEQALQGTGFETSPSGEFF